MKVGVTNLRVKYSGSSELLFNDLSLQIQKGEKVLLLGPSGCGKSTLLQVLSGLIPSAVPVPMKVEENVIAESAGYVFQDPDAQFCMPYVDEEMAFVLENRGISREDMDGLIQMYLHKVGLHFENAHVEISSLSQGMKQRLAIASVLSLEPDVLYLDEPTALLDPEGTTDVWETIKRIDENQTMVIVEHKVDTVIDFVHRVVLFDENGNIIADADPETILSFYKHKMKEYGIWYPGVWDEHKEELTLKRSSNQSNSVVTVEDLKGYRGKNCMITLPELEICEGEWIVVTGENGAGKSSLLLSMMNVLKTTGQVCVNGKKLRSIEEAREELAFVFQNPEFQFVTHSVYDELAYSITDHVHEKVTNWLTEYDLLHLQDQHPYQLSTGQKRKLSVGTALFGDQRVLLLDEPTFGQDAKNTFKLLQYFEELRSKGTIILMVTHDPNIVKTYATREWVISKGALMCDRRLNSREEEIVHAVDS
ncbi:ABC transporter ATP-binding protein [Guptibacillus algicola]|uniref:ABC transporter ATP-binding protein n=1 Tax=Guptibacillus algicola TaxID=225844 RepID=UPI001CD381A6|nr:ABC transporter ATP-binding protein [Alkalihalobacillus algicola]MCA0987772.1 energy-coupling factor ABC transporter ATP-binding protein [Alkalihalobacillus algicola]